MKLPFYIYTYNGGRTQHWSGPWDTQEAFDRALALAKQKHPKTQFQKCGYSEEDYQAESLADASILLSSLRGGPDLSSLEAC